MGTTSTARILIEDALAKRNTTLAEFVTTGRADGKPVRNIAAELTYVTGIPISWRTLYRWVERLDQEQAS